MIEVLCGLKTIIFLFRACFVKLFCDKYILGIMRTISIRANIYSHVKNKFIFVPGKWRYVHASDLSIAQWLILSCTQPNINCLGKI